MTVGEILALLPDKTDAEVWLLDAVGWGYHLAACGQAVTLRSLQTISSAEIVQILPSAYTEARHVEIDAKP